MNISNGAWEWDRMVKTAGGRGHRSTCFARVVSGAKFRRLAGRPIGEERAVNRPDLAVASGTGRRG